MVPQTLSRREALSALSCGFGGLALNALAQNESGKQGPFSGPTFHHAPKAKRVIFIFMAGGVSHVDSYDYKENLYKHDGKMMRFDDARTLAKTRKIIEHRVMKPLWKFKQYGQSGQHVSELFPHTAQHVDLPPQRNAHRRDRPWTKHPFPAHRQHQHDTSVNGIMGRLWPRIGKQ